MSTKPIEEMTDEELEAAEQAATGSDPTAQAPAAAPADAPAAPAPAPAAPAPSPADTAAAPAPVAVVTGKVEGVASKDGKRVLPYSALQAARRDSARAQREADEARQRAADLEKQLENLKAGKAPDGAETLTEAEVKQMEEDFPEHGKKMRAAFNQLQRLQQQAAHAPAPAAQEHADDPLQEAIDEVPLLVEWQTSAAHADKFQRAIAHDAVLKDSPKWKNKPLTDRFAEAARLTADEFDIPYSTKQTSAPSPASAPAPDLQHPNTLSDFKGGAVADHGQQDFGKMPATRMLNRFQSMSDEEIDAALAKYG